jgi:hypothetical protein
MSLSWTRVAERITGGRTVYWNGTAADGWRVAVVRVDFDAPGTQWRFNAYQPSRHTRAGQKVHESPPIGTVAQARRAAEAWLTEHVKES